MHPGPRHGLNWPALAPGIFVLLWASGFIAGKMGLPYARPFTILVIRFAIATLFMLVVCLATRASWPKTKMQAFHVAVVGVLLQSVYLGGCYVAMGMGIPAGVTALIVGLAADPDGNRGRPAAGRKGQRPAMAGPGHRFRRGDAGALGQAAFRQRPSRGHFLCPDRPCGHHLGDDLSEALLRGGRSAQQCAPSNMPRPPSSLLPMMWLFGVGEVRWTGAFIVSIAWLILVLSIGAFTLLLWMIRKGRRFQGREPVLSDAADGSTRRLFRLRRDAGTARACRHGAGGRRRGPGEPWMNEARMNEAELIRARELKIARAAASGSSAMARSCGGRASTISRRGRRCCMDITGHFAWRRPITAARRKSRAWCLASTAAVPAAAASFVSRRQKAKKVARYLHEREWSRRSTSRAGCGCTTPQGPVRAVAYVVDRQNREYMGKLSHRAHRLADPPGTRRQRQQSGLPRSTPCAIWTSSACPMGRCTVCCGWWRDGRKASGRLAPPPTRRRQPIAPGHRDRSPRA